MYAELKGQPNWRFLPKTGVEWRDIFYSRPHYTRDKPTGCWLHLNKGLCVCNLYTYSHTHIHSQTHAPKRTLWTSKCFCCCSSCCQLPLKLPRVFYTLCDECKCNSDAWMSALCMHLTCVYMYILIYVYCGVCVNVFLCVKIFLPIFVSKTKVELM